MIATLGGNAASLAAKPVTTTTPVVFYGSADPVEAGLVASLNRPGGNVTGVVTLNIDTGQKRLELGSTTARSGDEVALIADTISHYPPVLNASLSNKFLAPVSKKKNAARPWVTGNFTDVLPSPPFRNTVRPSTRGEAIGWHWRAPIRGRSVDFLHY